MNEAISYDEFDDRYKPVMEIGDEDYMYFNTLADAKAFHSSSSIVEVFNDVIWSASSADDSEVMLQSGIHMVNRLYFILTKYKPTGRVFVEDI